MNKRFALQSKLSEAICLWDKNHSAYFDHQREKPNRQHRFHRPSELPLLVHTVLQLYLERRGKAFFPQNLILDRMQ